MQLQKLARKEYLELRSEAGKPLTAPASPHPRPHPAVQRAEHVKLQLELQMLDAERQITAPVGSWHQADGSGSGGGSGGHQCYSPFGPLDEELRMLELIWGIIDRRPNNVTAARKKLRLVKRYAVCVPERWLDQVQHWLDTRTWKTTAVWRDTCKLVLALRASR